MKARYLVRFDDICPTMNWEIWRGVEAILRENRVRPIMSVIPDNGDKKLFFGDCRQDFWDVVRRWKEWGWTIGMHGYQHRYLSAESGIVGVKKASEFAGFPLEEQRAKLEAAREIFRREGVQPRVWVAPGHSFDDNTLRVLKTLGLCVVSDGLFLFPRLDPDGMLWIPQQLWGFRRLPFGIWTVCLHHNRWDSAQLAKFARDIVSYKSHVVSLDDVVRDSQQLRPAPLKAPLASLFGWLVRRRLRAINSGVRGRIL